MPVQDPTNRGQLVQAFAQTYEPPSEVSSWHLVQQYYRVQQYSAEHPDQGSAAVASALNLPRSRIRTWVDSDGKPDPLHGIETVQDYGWFDLTWTDETLRALVICVSWIFSGGSINRNHVPSFAVDPETQPYLEQVLTALGTDVSIFRPESDDQATELRPDTDATALGRLLECLGAPQGPKNAERSLTLPRWLAEAPREVRLAFLRTYMCNRGVGRPGAPETPLQFREDRPQSYRDDLQSLINSLFDTDVVRGDAATLRLTTPAAALLWRPPTTPTPEKKRTLSHPTHP